MLTFGVNLMFIQIVKSASVRFDPKILCVPAYSGLSMFVSVKFKDIYAYFILFPSKINVLSFLFFSVEKLISLSEEEWSGFLLQLCSSLEEQRPSTTQPSSQSTAIRSKLNLLCYLCCVAGHTTIANKLINSTLVG